MREELWRKLNIKDWSKAIMVRTSISESSRHSERRSQKDWGRSWRIPIRFTLRHTTFHWNVTGPMFQTLHLMFEQQYNELALAVDLVAERIRALGHPAPGSYAQFSKLSSISEATGVPKAEDMIRQLVEGQQAVVRTLRNVFPTAEKASDQVTIDLLTQRMQVHEKTAWMLRSLLE